MMEQNLYELPDGWKWSTLQDQTMATRNINPTSTPNQRFTYIDISAIDRERLEIVEPKEILGADAPSRAKKEVITNDVLFATTRPYLKNVAVFNGDVDHPVASTGFCVLRSADTTDHRYLFYFLTTDFVQNQIAPYITGAQYPAVTDKNLKRAAIPIPTIDEQKRIAAMLDALFTRIDAAITHLQENLELSKALFASALDKVFGSVETSEKVKVKDVSLAIQYGHTAKASDAGNARFLRITDIQNGDVDWEQVPYVEINSKDVEKYRLNQGDIVFARSGATSGKSFLIQSVPENSIFASYLIRIIPDVKTVLPEFVFLYFQSPEYWGQVGTKVAGAAQPNINGAKLGEFVLPLPSLEQQTEIVEHLNNLVDRTRNLEAETQERLDHLTSLKSSLLDAAFRGQLSTHDLKEMADVS